MSTQLKTLGQLLKSTKIVGAVVLLALVLAVVSYRYYSQSPAERFFYSQLKRALRSDRREIPVRELTDFQWDKVYFVAPYIGYRDSNGKICGSGDNDNDWALAFTQQGVLCNCIEGRVLDFDRELEKTSGFSSTAVLTVHLPPKVFSLREGGK